MGAGDKKERKKGKRRKRGREGGRKEGRNLQNKSKGKIFWISTHSGTQTAPLPEALLCCSMWPGTQRGPLPGYCSVDPCIMHIKGHPVWSPTLQFTVSGFRWANLSIVQLPMLVCGERIDGDGSTTLYKTQQYFLSSMAARFSSTSISHHSLLPHIPSVPLRSQYQASFCDSITIPKLQVLGKHPGAPFLVQGMCQGLSYSHSTFSVLHSSVSSCLWSVPPVHFQLVFFIHVCV